MSISKGPYEVIGLTIVGGRVPRVDSEGVPIPGKFTRPAIAEMNPSGMSGQELRANASLFCNAPDVLAQRDELAQHLRAAVNYIEHGEAHRRDIADVALLRRMLDREVNSGSALRLSTGLGISGSTATFDITAARAALAAIPAARTNGPTYRDLIELVSQLATSLEDTLEAQHKQEPREVIAAPQRALVRKAFDTIELTATNPAVQLDGEELETGTSLHP
ncbi:hypothetical protein ACW0US_18100 [Xanthomonas euvesicatoria]